MKIYVASSWRNPRHPAVVEALRQAGHKVYDYRHPDGSGSAGFAWGQIGAYPPMCFLDYKIALNHALARRAYRRDITAPDNADCVIGLQPFGASTALEMGYSVGHGKLTIQLLVDPPQLELMGKMIDYTADRVEQLLSIIDRCDREAERLMGHEA